MQGFLPLIYKTLTSFSSFFLSDLIMASLSLAGFINSSNSLESLSWDFFNFSSLFRSRLAPIKTITTTIASIHFNPATKNKNAAGKYATVSRYKNPNNGLEANGKSAWNVPTMENTLPTSSGSTVFVIKDLLVEKNWNLFHSSEKMFQWNASKLAIFYV